MPELGNRDPGECGKHSRGVTDWLESMCPMLAACGQAAIEPTSSLADCVRGATCGPAGPRICGCCGESFTTGSRTGNVYCSFACQRQGVRERAGADRTARMASRSCARCSAAVPLDARGDARFCSTVCQQADWYDANQDRAREAATAWRLSNHEARSESHHRRRARKLGTQCGPIDRAEVWLRDEGRCWICDSDVDSALVYPERMCASLDHVIPLSRGGGHVMENVALAHLRCNISKKDKILDRVPRWAQAEVMSDVVA